MVAVMDGKYPRRHHWRTMDTESRTSDEVIEVEAERLPLEGEAAQGAPKMGKHLVHVLSPVIAGLIIDAIDVGTIGGLGMRIGLPIGALAGYFLGGQMGFRGKRRLYVALGAAFYCWLPITSFLPLGTLLGVLARLRSFSPSEDSARR
jgi:hypothetical protein